MSQDIIIPFDETILRLPSCLSTHIQLHSELNQLKLNNYVDLIKKLCQTNQSRICGIIRKNQSEIIVLALAFYRIHLTTFDRIRFEIYDLIVDEKERNHGLGTRLFQYLIQQAKECGTSSMILHCDLTNTHAQRFFFRQNLTITSFEFCLNQIQLLENMNHNISVIDITDLPECEQLLIKTQSIFRQLRPHLPTDKNLFIKQIRDICQTGPARMLIAINENQDILGLAIYRLSYNIKYSEHIYCDDLVTDETKRSSGVGRALINYMKTEALKLGLKRIILDSGCQRGRPHKFYYREGFYINQFKFTLLF